MTGDFIALAQGTRGGRQWFPSYRGRTEREALEGMWACLSREGGRVHRFDVIRAEVR